MEWLQQNSPLVLMVLGAVTTTGAALYIYNKSHCCTASAMAPQESSLIAEAAHLIEKTISIGAPVYNKGHHDMCYLLYRGTLSYLSEGKFAPLASHFATALTKAKQEAIEEQTGEQSTLTQSAWTLRHAMDEFMNKIEEDGRD